MKRTHWWVTSLALISMLAGCTDVTNTTQRAEVENAGQQAPNPTHMQPIQRKKPVIPNTPWPQVLGVRKFPYPYQSMLAISSDADHETLRKFNLVHEFLNTTGNTPFGKGVGLDISDSFFMYNGSNLPQQVDWPNEPLSKQMTYFAGTSSVPYAASIIDQYIHCGWMDSIHTFGDFSMTNQRVTKFTRALGLQAIQALKLAGDVVNVWIDHGNQSNVDNFGSYGIRKFYNYQQGANPKSIYYHTDVTIPYGIRFVWADEVSTQFGRNSVIYPIRLPDGQRVWGFYRFTSEYLPGHKQPEWLWSSDNLAAQLSYHNLAVLIAKHQYSILAQHLSSSNHELPLPTNAVGQLRYLEKLQNEGKILVARTSRLLQYNVAQDYVRYTVTHTKTETYIHINAIGDPVFGLQAPTVSGLRGITFYVSDPKRTEIEFGNTPLPESLIQRNPSDGLYPSIGIRWYPANTANYAVTAPGVL